VSDSILISSFQKFLYPLFYYIRSFASTLWLNQITSADLTFESIPPHPALSPLGRKEGCEASHPPFAAGAIPLFGKEGLGEIFIGLCLFYCGVLDSFKSEFHKSPKMCLTKTMGKLRI